MQPGYTYTPDDFAQPGFCPSCGAHVPKALLAANGGRCPNCVHGMRPGGQPPSFAGPMGGFAYRKPAFWRGSGFQAFVMLGVLCGLIFYAYRLFLTPAQHPVAHASSGQTADSAPNIAHASVQDAPPGPGNRPLALTDVDSQTAASIKDQAMKDIAATFGQSAASSWGFNVGALTDSTTGGATYVATGSFPCMIDGDQVEVKWKIGYVSDGAGGWRVVDHEAYYETGDGLAQFDWTVRRFIHLAH